MRGWHVQLFRDGVGEVLDGGIVVVEGEVDGFAVPVEGQMEGDFELDVFVVVDVGLAAAVGGTSVGDDVDVVGTTRARADACHEWDSREGVL